MEEIANERMERAVVACCILDGRRVIVECLRQKVTAKSFWVPQCCFVFRACLRLYEAKNEINLLTVGEDLREHGELEKIGGYACLNAITDEIDCTVCLYEYIKNLKKYELLRELQGVFAKACESVERCTIEPINLATRVAKKLDELVSEHAVSDNCAISEVVQNAAIELMDANKPENMPIMTGFKTLDDITGGLRRGEFIVIAARPSVGKTALAFNIAENVAKSEKPHSVLFFSMEMTATQLGKRMLRDRFSGNWNGVFGCFMEKENTEKQTLRYVNTLKNCPIRIDETGKLTLDELCRRISLEAEKGNADVVIIDYMQLLKTTERQTRYEQMTEISFRLKAMAKEFHIPLIALSQLNRMSCKDPSKPNLHDLRESGAIEQDADVVLLLGREDKDGKETERHVYVAKNRNGRTGYVSMEFDGNRTRFYEVS
jgi:replicative DNA helicase